ncbi:hypothetical protein GCM10010360_05520 [Streptomyces nogalater]
MLGCVLLRVGKGCRRFGGVVLRQRFVAREGACDAGVRARGPKALRGQPAGERSLLAGRPDALNV